MNIFEETNEGIESFIEEWEKREKEQQQQQQYIENIIINDKNINLEEEEEWETTQERQIKREEKKKREEEEEREKEREEEEREKGEDIFEEFMELEKTTTTTKKKTQREEKRKRKRNIEMMPWIEDLEEEEEEKRKRKKREEEEQKGRKTYLPNMENNIINYNMMGQQQQQQQQYATRKIYQPYQQMITPTTMWMGSNNNMMQQNQIQLQLQLQQQQIQLQLQQQAQANLEKNIWMNKYVDEEYIQHSTPSPRAEEEELNMMMMEGKKQEERQRQQLQLQQQQDVYHPKIEKVTLTPFTTNAKLSLRAACGNLDVRQDKVLKMKLKANDKNVTFYNWEENQNSVVKSNRAIYVEFVRVKYRKEGGGGNLLGNWKTSSERVNFIRLRQFEQTTDGELQISFKLPRTQLQYCNRTIQNVLALVIRVHYLPMGYALDQYALEVKNGQRKANFSDIQLHFVCATKKRGRLFNKVPYINTQENADILKLTHYEQSTALNFTEEKDTYRSAVVQSHVTTLF